MSAPYHIISGDPAVPLFLFGDHASRHIPPRYNGLGLSPEHMERHIAWDIGTEDLIRSLCARFDCAGVLAGFSRLLIDPNRDLTMESLIPHVSDGTKIHGNHGLEQAHRQERIETLYHPYHTALSDHIAPLERALVISVHSFTPKPETGGHRTLDMGLLVKHDERSATAFQSALSGIAPELSVGINEPYSAHDLNHTIDQHVAPRDLPHLAIEIRQDHIGDDAGVDRFSNLIGDALQHMMES